MLGTQDEHVCVCVMDGFEIVLDFFGQLYTCHFRVDLKSATAFQVSVLDVLSVLGSICYMM